MEAGTDSAEKTLEERREILKRIPFRNRNIRFPDAIMVSYPRSGLCWMRWMLWELRRRWEGVPEGGEELNPTVEYDHDRAGLVTSNKYWTLKKIRSRRLHRWTSSRKLIFLARDPRDVLSSNFMQIVVRFARYRRWPDFSSFLRDEVMGIRFLCHWLNWWIETGQHLCKKTLIIFYERTRQYPEEALRSVTSFVGAEGVPNKCYRLAVEASTLEVMRRHEDEHKNLFVDGISGLEVGRPEARMVGEGKIGRWKDWDKDDREYALSAMNTELPEFLKEAWL